MIMTLTEHHQLINDMIPGNLLLSTELQDMGWSLPLLPIVRVPSLLSDHLPPHAPGIERQLSLHPGLRQDKVPI